MEQSNSADLSIDLRCPDSFSLAEQSAGVRLIQHLELINLAQEAVDGLSIVFSIPSLDITTDAYCLGNIITYSCDLMPEVHREINAAEWLGKHEMNPNSDDPF